MTPRPLDKLGGEVVYDTLDLVGREREVSSAGPTLGGVGPEHGQRRLRIAEQYRVGRVCLHLHFRGSGEQLDFGDAEQLCAVIHANPRVPVGTRRSFDPDELRLLEPAHTDGSQQQSMLVRIVETGDDHQAQVGQEGVGATGEVYAPVDALPDVVWLQGVDACPMPFDDPGQRSVLVQPVLVFIVEHRELGRALGARPDVRELHREVVQGGSQVVDGIARDQAKAQGNVWLTDSQAHDMVARVRITLRDKSVGLAFREDTGFVSEGLQMLPGAFYLQPSTK